MPPTGKWPEAIAAWRKAADKGSTSAMVELGVLYGTGAGVARDEAQARKLFERAAEAGNPRGVSNLAALGGGGASADPARARELLAKAAETNAEAQYQLGMMLAEGNGGTKDDVAARALFEKAAAQNHPGALERMGAFGRRAAAGRKIRTPPKPTTSAPPRSATRTPRRRWSGWMSLRDQGQARQRRDEFVLLNGDENMGPPAIGLSPAPYME